MGLRMEDDELNVDILYLKCLQVSNCARPGAVVYMGVLS